MLNPIMPQHICLRWRNGLASWTSNPKVVDSIPTVRCILLYPGKGGILTGKLFSLGLSYIQVE